MSFTEAMEEGKWISALKEVTFSLEADLVGKKGRLNFFRFADIGPFPGLSSGGKRFPRAHVTECWVFPGTVTWRGGGRRGGFPEARPQALV